MDLTPHPEALRARVEHLVRNTDRTFLSIAAEAGLHRGTVGTWNFRYGWRPPRQKPRRRDDPTLWPASRRLALERLYRSPDVEPAILAAALGVSASGMAVFVKACGITRPRPPPGTAGAGRTPAALRAALRGHIARQVERFDAALKGEAPLDSGKVLRDLGGLKRLLDELDDDDRTRGPGHDGETRSGDRGAGGTKDHAGGIALDLPALRAQIARRYAAFAGERAAAGLPGEPAAGADPRPLA